MNQPDAQSSAMTAMTVHDVVRSFRDARPGSASVIALRTLTTAGIAARRLPSA